MMPAIGDQHKPNGATTANPFEEAKTRMSEYTAQEIATLQSRLDKQLGPEYISSRPGAAGQKVHYLAAEKVINLANEIFGFNGWSSGIQAIQIDFVDENPQTGKITLGLSVVVRVTLRDGTYHEDIGYGHIENCKGKAAAFEKAKKEGTTDALKRALRTFGNVLGNCVYDKEYLAKVTKVKVGTGRWDVEALHRHPDFVARREHSVKAVESAAASKDTPAITSEESFDLGDFDDAEFDDNDFVNPDEVALPHDPAEQRRGRSQQLGPPQTMRPPAHVGNNTPSRPPVDRAIPGLIAASRNQQSTANTRILHDPSTTSEQHNSSTDNTHSSSPGVPSLHFAGPQHHQHQQPFDNNSTNTVRPAGFYSARAAGIIDEENKIAAANLESVPRFNPHAESPSIRKTAGIDHNRSTRLSRDLKPAGPPLPKEAAETKSDQEPQRRPAVTGQAAQSPLARPMSTSAYRPPTRRGMDSFQGASGSVPMAQPPAITDSNSAAVLSHSAGAGGAVSAMVGNKRSPLGDVSNLQSPHQHSVTARTDDGLDAKRQKVSSGMLGAPATGMENVG